MTPRQAGWPTSRLFKGAGHVYMRNAWDDPDATWSFFGAGPRYAAHSLDDEGHFLIARKGWVVCARAAAATTTTTIIPVARWCSILSLFSIRRTVCQSRRGRDRFEARRRNHARGYQGLSGSDVGHRGQIVAFRQGKTTPTARRTFPGLIERKASEVTRQYLYLQGERDYFIIFDRVDAKSSSYPKHWFLHLPTEPSVSGPRPPLSRGTSTPACSPELLPGSATPPVTPLSTKATGRSRAFLKTVLPAGATLVRRGGAGHERWGHPANLRAGKFYERGWRRAAVRALASGGESTWHSGREYFLHVIEIADSTATAMSEITTVAQDTSRAGLKITPANGNPIEVQFNLRGDLDAWIKMDPAGGFMQLSTGIDSTGGRTVGGDFNGDGRLGMLDALALLLRGRSNPEDPSVDFNGDGKWSLSDAVDLVRYMWDGRLSLASSDNLAGK